MEELEIKPMIATPVVFKMTAEDHGAMREFLFKKKWKMAAFLRMAVREAIAKHGKD